MDYTEKDFGKILKGNALKMRRLMLKSGTSCMRVYDRNLGRFPVTVDLYGPYARITDYSEDGLDAEDERVCCDIVSRMLYIQTNHVVFHHRPKRVGKEQHGVQDEESLLVQVSENELVFTVDLTKRIDTGLFLDHMVTRQSVEKMSRGCRVLNLFSYTGAFSVYAARGGAERVESVDLSSTYTAWAQKNLADNGFSQALYPCIAADAWQYVLQALENGKKYDLVILDPPSFSNSRKMDHDFDVQRDYVKWIAVVNALLAQDGALVFSTNLGTFKMEQTAIKGYEIREITQKVAAPGFTHRLGTARTWLLKKSMDVRLSARDLQAVERRAGRDARRDETLEEETMSDEERMNEDEVLMNNEDGMKTEQVMDNEEAVIDEAMDETEEAVEETNEEIEADDQESPEAEPNTVEDDLLTLRWDDEDIAPLMEEEQAEEPNTERKPVREDAERHDDRRRDDRRGSDRPFSRDRNERRPYGERSDRPSFRDRDERRPYGERSDRPSFPGRDERRPYGERSDRPSFRDRDERRPYGERSDRPSFPGRDERRPYGERSDRPSFRDRDERRPYGERSDRPSFRDRDERKPYGERSDRPSFPGRDERRPYGERSDRPSFRDRDERRPYGERSDRPSFPGRDERRPYGERSDRPSFRDRDERRPYGERSDRPSFPGRDERRPYGERSDRPSFRDRDERRPYGERSDRPSFRDRDERKPYGERSDRPSFRDRPYGERSDHSFTRRGDDRPSFGHRDDTSSRPAGERRERKSAPKPYGFDSFRDTKTRGEHEDDSFFWLDEEKKDK